MQHPVIALVLAAGWVAVCCLGILAKQALAGPAQRRLEQAGNAADQAAGWWLSMYRRRYRRWILDSRRYVDVKDLATAGDHTPELNDVYIDLALVRRAPHQVSGNPLSGVPEDAAGRHSIGEFLDHHAPVVLAIIGPPGCGKSTLLAHVACRTAMHGRGERRRVPILLALREHAAVLVADARTNLPQLVRSAAAGVPGAEPHGWWDRQLRSGRCVVLLDGLDEIARPEDRRAVAKWVERQIVSYSGNHFVITSRPHGFTGPVIAQADILAVRPFTAEQIQRFLDRWYVAIERRATGAANKAQMRAVRIMARQSANRLLALLQTNPALSALAVNPLLLTMIATVHRYRGALPGSRADLYAEICQVMLSRRIQAKDLPELLPWSAKHKLLTALAYQMMRDRVSDLPGSQALGILGPLLRRLPQSVTGQVFLDDVSHNGLLSEPVPGRYSFAHLTFQEYLAARCIGDNPGLASTLADAVGDHWWREATLFYAAVADSDQIVRACLDRATIPALTLAFDCADASSELAPDLRDRLNQVRDQAFERDGDPRHRRLIAAVLTTRLAHRTITTSTGTRICDRPVPADLYWLFQQDIHGQVSDHPHVPDADRPASGTIGGHAVTFPRWLNDVTTGSAQGEFRLPERSELDEPIVIDAFGQQFPESMTSVWTQPKLGVSAPELWVRPGQAHPHQVPADTIRREFESDATDTDILTQILIAAALDSVLTSLIVIAHARTHVRSQALDRARDHAHSLALDLALGHTPDLDLDRARALDLGHARALRHARAHGHAYPLVLDLACALDLARSFGCALGHAHALGQARALCHALDLARALDDARATALKLADCRFGLPPEVAIDLVGDAYAELTVPLPEIRAIPLMWISRGPLGRASRVALGASASEAGTLFAASLTSLAGVSKNGQVEASLDGSLGNALRRVRPAAKSGDAASGWTSIAAACVADLAAPVLDGRRPVSRLEAATVRTIAMALAADKAGITDRAARMFLTLTATVTLLQQRQFGEASAGEAILLALA
ncbi:MAG TPA: NACHT domain-containing protein [Streptosporangiaceae bacterium]|nr:NACHT domain-containing protein [Streptosporangiaceae bacterium]